MSGIDSLFSDGLVQIIRRRSRYSAMEGHISAVFMHYALCRLDISMMSGLHTPLVMTTSTSGTLPKYRRYIPRYRYVVE